MLPKTTKQIVVAAAIGFLFLPVLVRADGMLIRPDPYADRWDFGGESDQTAFINYESGREKLIVSIGLEQEASDGAVWLFPVPADPQKVTVDIIESLPQLSGEEITKKAKSLLPDIRQALQATQIYSAPFVFFTTGSVGSTSDNMLRAPLGGTKSTIEQDVTVYEHLEKSGITSEIIAAKTGTGLYQYLSGKKLQIEAGSIPVLDEYIGQDYSFIVSWISNTAQAQNNASLNRGVLVTFPTDKMYYPLRPTSVYGSQIIPATIRVIGYVKPTVFTDIKPYITTEYYVEENFTPDSSTKTFYDKTGDIYYTKIEINSPSKLLTEDLWMKKINPLTSLIPLFIAKYPFLFGLLLLVIVSLVTGLPLGLIFFKDSRRRLGRLTLISLTNCLTLLGLIFGVALTRTKEEKPEMAPLMTELKQKGYRWRRRLAMVLLIIDVPLLLISLAILPSLTAALINSPASSDSISFVVFVLITLAIFIVMMRLKKIKNEDLPLFAQLTKNGYSVWMLQPKDSHKPAFVITFSVVFLFMSWAVTKLVEISL